MNDQLRASASGSGPIRHSVSVRLDQDGVVVPAMSADAGLSVAVAPVPVTVRGARQRRRLEGSGCWPDRSPSTPNAAR